MLRVLSTNTPLDPEIQRLTAELRDDPRYARLQQLKRMRDEYLALPVVPVADDTGAEGGKHSKSGRQRSPDRERALQETFNFLLGKTTPTKLAEIDAHLDRMGIRLAGSDPMNNLSALLSTSGQFQSHGRSGWTLPLNKEGASSQ